MATIQDLYADATKLATQEGSEVAGGLLLPQNLDEGVCLDFNGSSHYVDLGTPSVQLAGECTLVGWVRLDTVAAGLINFYSQQNGATNRKLSFGVNRTSGKLDAAVGPAVAHTSTTTLVISRWYHVALVRSGSTGSWTYAFYIDGVFDSSATTATDPSSGNHITKIGRRADTSANTFDGLVDDWRIWTSALTAEQIQKIYSTGENPSTPASWYKFNEGSGVTAVDSGSGGNNGDLTGHAPTWTTSHNPFYASRARATSTDLVTGLGATAINSLAYTLNKKPGGTAGKLQFSSDGTTWKNANGDLVSNTGGYTFDGVNDQIDLGNSSAHTPAGSEMSIAIWVKTTKLNGQRIVSLSRASNATAFGIAIAVSAGAADLADGTPNVFYRNSGGGLLSLKSTQNIYDGKTHHLVAVLNGTSISLYIDGVLSVSASDASAAQTLTFHSTVACLGRLGGIGTFFYSGIADDLRFYHQALTNDQVWDLFSRHKGTGTIPHGWWKLDGNATDSGSGGNNGTVNGATSVTEFSSLPAFGEPISEDNDVPGFDGVNDVVTLGAPGDFDAYTGGSISFWFKLSALSRDHGLICYEVSQLRRLYVGVSTSNQVTVLLTSSAGTVLFISASGVTLQTGRWYHVVYTSVGSANSLWIDGRQTSPTYSNGSSSTHAFFDSISGNSCQLALGRARGGGGAYFYGACQIANVSIHSAALSSIEIPTDFRNGYPGSSNLVNLWSLDEGTGTTADDPIGGLDGSISGATWQKDIYRPQPSTPAQQTINLTGLGFTSAAYYRALWEQYHHDRALALDEATLDYTGTSRALRMSLAGVGL